MLTTKRRYPVLFRDPISMATDIVDNLQGFTPIFYTAFCQRYSGNLYITCISVGLTGSAHTDKS